MPTTRVLVAWSLFLGVANFDLILLLIGTLEVTRFPIYFFVCLFSSILARRKIQGLLLVAWVFMALMLSFIPQVVLYRLALTPEQLLVASSTVYLARAVHLSMIGRFWAMEHAHDL